MQIVQTKILGFLTIGVGYYETVDAIDKAAGKAGECLRLANIYMGQKGSLVEGRSWLFDRIVEATGFPQDPKKNKTVEVKDKSGAVTGTKVVNSETEGEYIKRFVASATPALPISTKALTVTTEDGKTNPVPATSLTDSKAAEAWVQSLIDAHGPFNNDAAHPERKSGPKTPPQYALKAAEKVLGGKEGDALKATVAKWAATFTKEGISFLPFDGADAAVNKTNFAWAAHEREEQRKRVRTESEYK